MTVEEIEQLVREQMESDCRLFCGFCAAGYPAHRDCHDSSSYPLSYEWVHFVTGVEKYEDTESPPVWKTRVVEGLKPLEVDCKATRVRENFVRRRRALKSQLAQESVSS